MLQRLTKIRNESADRRKKDFEDTYTSKLDQAARLGLSEVILSVDAVQLQMLRELCARDQFTLSLSAQGTDNWCEVRISWVYPK